MSPAHHQIHHSRNPAHFNKNLGSCLAVWDWMFGTLYIPAAENERLEFGVEPDREHAHTIRGELIAPFIRAAQMLKWPFGGRAQSAPLAPTERKQAY
jgi:sterol desaturase/sphingolipid hydroxylase (fatty acid hydroxylase superfamily)